MKDHNKARNTITLRISVKGMSASMFLHLASLTSRNKGTRFGGKLEAQETLFDHFSLLQRYLR